MIYCHGCRHFRPPADLRMCPTCKSLRCVLCYHRTDDECVECRRRSEISNAYDL